MNCSTPRSNRRQRRPRQCLRHGSRLAKRTLATHNNPPSRYGHTEKQQQNTLANRTNRATTGHHYSALGGTLLLSLSLGGHILVQIPRRMHPNNETHSIATFTTENPIQCRNVHLPLVCMCMQLFTGCAMDLPPFLRSLSLIRCIM